MKIRKIFRVLCFLTVIITLSAFITEWISYHIITAYPVYAQAPPVNRQYNLSAAAAQTAIGVFGNGASIFRLQYSPRNGTITTCTVSLQGSNDNSTWTDIIAGTTCTSAGQTGYYPATNGYIRVNLTALTLGTATDINIVVQGEYITKLNPVAQSTTIGSFTSGTPIVLHTGPGILHSYTTGTATGTTTMACMDALTITGSSYIVGTSLVTTPTFFVNPEVAFNTGLTCIVTGVGSAPITFWKN